MTVHYQYGIYDLVINPLALVIRIVKQRTVIFVLVKNRNLSFLDRLGKDQVRKFEPIGKVVWNTIKSSFVFVIF